MVAESLTRLKQDFNLNGSATTHLMGRLQLTIPLYNDVLLIESAVGAQGRRSAVCLRRICDRPCHASVGELRQIQILLGRVATKSRDEAAARRRGNTTV